MPSSTLIPAAVRPAGRARVRRSGVALLLAATVVGFGIVGPGVARGVACVTDRDCDDENACTTERCSGNECRYVPLSGTSCDDGNACTQGDACVSGTCRAGTALSCDDGDACTTDTCDAGAGCLHAGITLSLDTCDTDFQKTQLDVQETTPGKEKVAVKLLKGPALDQLDLGNPVDPGGTAYSVCVFDDAGALAGSLTVDAAGGDCGGKPCWKSLGGTPPDGKGYLYKDKTAAADGVTIVKMKAGAAGKPQLQVKAQNNAAKGQTALPVGIAAALAQSSAAVVAVLGGGGECFAGAVDVVKRQDATQFKAQGRGTCGDGVASLVEECDGADLGGAACTDLGFIGGTLACDADCRLDASACVAATCGDGAVNAAGEECDGADLAGADCTDLGFVGGTLACGDGCLFDTSGCDDGTRHVFVTSTSTDGDIGGLVGGDAMCQVLAEAAALGGTWTAWLSDATTDARDRITDARYVRLDGVVVAESLADLTDGGIAAPISVTELGTPRVADVAWVWTGTRDGGVGDGLDCAGWTRGDTATGSVGVFSTSQSSWTEGSRFRCTDQHALYCFED